jgi:hypothetical protein
MKVRFVKNHESLEETTAPNRLETIGRSLATTDATGRTLLVSKGMIGVGTISMAVIEGSRAL